MQATIQAADTDHVHVTLPPDGIAFGVLEQQIILHALTVCQWNITKAARFLRLSRDTLRYRIERLQLHAPDNAVPE
jgi:DNA-binding NtrC family response regulator